MQFGHWYFCIFADSIFSHEFPFMLAIFLCDCFLCMGVWATLLHEFHSFIAMIDAHWHCLCFVVAKSVEFRRRNALSSLMCAVNPRHIDLYVDRHYNCDAFVPGVMMGPINNYSVWTVSRLLYFFPYSLLSNYFLIPCLCLILFLLLPCASVWENTREWVGKYFLFWPKLHLSKHKGKKEWVV